MDSIIMLTMIDQHIRFMKRRKQFKCYRKKLKYLSEEKSSNLKKFDQFFQKGASSHESLLIKSLKRDIRNSFKSKFKLLNFENTKEWKKYCQFNSDSKSYLFYP